jgi:predicted polyphosphate/ATP-dependent NAD kinase
VNPIAGMGGRVALKGTDGPEALRQAKARGAEPLAPERAQRALARLDKDTRVLAAPGVMGGDLAAGAGLAHETTAPLLGSATGPLDTRNAVAEMCERGVALLLFAGGDGTARDIHDAIGGELPIVGIPTGVKMHSGVFAATPGAAGAAAAAYLRGATALHDAEIADVDEEAARHDRVTTRLYGSARVP